MANKNTDNLSKSSELNDFNIDSPENNTPDTADDFFEALDRKVNQGILEPEEEPALMQSEAEPETSEMSSESVEQEHNWEKRYADSSVEARKFIRIRTLCTCSRCNEKRPQFSNSCERLF